MTAAFLPAETDKDKMIERVGKLMRQAETASFEDEAKRYTEAAQRLISKYSIDEAVARAKITAIETRAIPIHRTIKVGEPGKRGLATYVNLFQEIFRANDVQCDIAHDSTYVIAFGFEADIDMCELLYTHLLVQMTSASTAYLKSGEFRSETTSRPIYEQGEVVAYTWNGPRYERICVGYEEVPVHGATARKSFQQAFTYQVGHRLAEARRYAIEQAEAARREDLEAQARQAAIQAAAQAEREGKILASLDEENADGPMNVTVDPDFTAEASASTELVLKGKTEEIKGYYDEHSTARGSWRGDRSSASAGYSNRASQAGRRAGKNASLGVHRQIG